LTPSPPPPLVVDSIGRVASTSTLPRLTPSPPPPLTAIHVDDEASHHEGRTVMDLLSDMLMEAQLKRPPQFHELFDQTHKKRGTDDYISEKAQEIASIGIDERYGGNNQHLEFDPNIWVAASGAPMKGHVYGFGYSLGTARVISSCSSSVSHATSPFTTLAALGGSFSAAPTMTPAQFREIINKTVS
ncbi:hypothetical protein Taro_025342, partial [Colocasia esculenta]|nr:hypothetical protein [Colocasia esculenta]